jgi:hypothetical protein
MIGVVWLLPRRATRPIMWCDRRGAGRWALGETPEVPLAVYPDPDRRDEGYGDHGRLPAGLPSEARTPVCGGQRRLRERPPMATRLTMIAERGQLPLAGRAPSRRYGRPGGWRTCHLSGHRIDVLGGIARSERRSRVCFYEAHYTRSRVVGGLAAELGHARACGVEADGQPGAFAPLPALASRSSCVDVTGRPVRRRAFGLSSLAEVTFGW